MLDALAEAIYLDSSAVVKRYVLEKGTDSINFLYNKCDTKEISISFSFWNIGEVLGALDQYRKRKWLTDRQYENAARTFASESLRLMILDVLDPIPVDSSILSDCWKLIEAYHIYQSDALQIVSCRNSKASFLLSADRSLIQVANQEGIEAIDIENFNDVKRIAS